MAGTRKGARKSKRRYGKECFREWGLKGGNPALIKKSTIGKRLGEQ